MKTFAAVAAFFLGTFAYAEAPGLPRPVKWSLIGSQAADVYTTRLFLQRGGYELNPLVNWVAPSTSRQVTVATAGAILETAGLAYAVRREWLKPKTGRTTAIVLTVVHGLLAGHNYRLTQRLKDKNTP